MTARWEDRTCAENPSAWDIDSDKLPWQRQAIADAKAGCLDCPLFDPCSLMLADRVEREGGPADIVGVIAATDYNDRVKRWGRLGSIAHGTPKGYRQHIRRGIDPCGLCRDANAAEKAAQRTPVEHGTRRGYDAHKRRGEPACEACRRGAAQAERDRIAAKETRTA